MDLRVILGKSLKEQFLKSKLKNLYASEDILVQGSEDIKLIKLQNDVNLILAGRVIGIRGSNNSLSKLEKEETELLGLSKNKNIEELLTAIEGRFLVIKVNGPNCEIATDRYGQIDMYYKKEINGAIFGSNLDLLELNSSKIIYDQAAVFHSLYVYGYRPPKKHTLYKNIKRLGIGEIAKWKSGKLSFETIAPFISETKTLTVEDNKKYKDIFLDAIEKRSSKEGNNIVYLSSGWDSTALLAGLVHLWGSKKVKAVIGRMHFSKESGVCNPFEIKRAKEVADYFGVDMDIVEFDYYKRGTELTDEFAPFFRNQMATSMACYQWLELGKHIQKYYKDYSVFCGEISDGVHNFGFSQMLSDLSHPKHEFREYSDKMATYLYGPSFMKSIWDGTFKKDSVFNFLQNKIDGKFDAPGKTDEEKTFQVLASLFTRDRRFPFWSLDNLSYISEEGKKLYNNDIEEIYLRHASQEIVNSPSTIYSWYIHLYNSFHWNGGTVSTILMTEDLFNIKINLPFRDSRLQEFLCEMPESWGRGLEMRPTKYPLKWVLENAINYPLHLQIGPHSYLYDVDPNFDHAAEWNYRSAFRPQYKKMMEKRLYSKLMSPEWFDLDYFDRITSNYINGKEILEERNDLEHLVYLSVMGWY